MTKADLKVLATLPRVIRALSALAAEQARLRGAMAQAGMGTPAEHARPVHRMTQLAEYVEPPAQVPAVAPGHASLMTQERMEYLAQSKAEQPTLPHLQEAKDARKAYLASLRGSPLRDEKLQQFKSEPGDEPEAVTVGQEELRMSGGD